MASTRGQQPSTWKSGDNVARRAATNNTNTSTSLPRAPTPAPPFHNCAAAPPSSPITSPPPSQARKNAPTARATSDNEVAATGTTHRMRTRVSDRTGVCSNSARALTLSDLLKHLPKLAIGTNVRVSWFFYDDENATHVDEGTVIVVESKSVDIVYADVGRRPFPPVDPNVGVIAFDVISTHALGVLPPLTFTTRPIAQLCRTVFADGGCIVV